MVFDSLVKIFIFLGVCLSKIEAQLFSKGAWILIESILLKISNLNWSLLDCLKLRYINFFGSNFKFCFGNSIYDVDHPNQF